MIAQLARVRLGHILILMVALTLLGAPLVMLIDGPFEFLIVVVRDVIFLVLPLLAVAVLVARRINRRRSHPAE